MVSGVKALSEIVNDKVTGLLSAPLDRAALADVLSELLDSPICGPSWRQREGVGRARTHLGAQRDEVP